jgi:metal-sulfur cluster biosynthetic enzyme
MLQQCAERLFAIPSIGRVGPLQLLVFAALTSPGCPAAGSLPGEVKTTVQAVPGVTEVEVQVVWDPTWDPSMMSEDARLELGLL